MKNLYCFLSLIIISFITITEFTYASVPDGINLTKTSQGYHVDFTLPSYQLVPVTVEGKDYMQLTIPDYGVNPEVGLPALPLVSFNMFIEYGETQPVFEIKSLATEEKILHDKIYPFQMPWEKTSPLDERPFTINTEYYNSIGNMDQPFVKISDPFIIAGVKGVIVTIYPFKYNPMEDKLISVASGNFDILLDYPVNPVTDKSEMLNDFFKNVFVNYEGSSSRSTMKYLIITAPTFESGMQQFVTHKISKGFDVDMFNTNVTGTTNTAIKSFIQQRYNDPGTKPEFILLVGDVVQIPSWIGSGEGTPNTDLNYVQLEGGDYFADAFIGRFSIATATELQNAINKSFFMEDYVGTLTKKNIFMASNDNYTISEGTHNYVINSYFDPAGYTNLKLYSHTYNATTQQLINALNDNQQFAIYSGHGGEYSWADGPPLSQQQVRDLTNTWYPFVYSFACVTGSYQVSECFGETWLRTENGASTFYGSSVNSYWDEDDILERKVFQAMFEDDLTRVTPMFDLGKIYLVNYYGGVVTTGSTLLRYLEMYNLMGDPSMPVVQQIPPDTTPPEPVTDLTAVNQTSNSLSLNWTAPFDSTFGGVATYDIRYSLTMINNDNDFNNALQKLLTGQSDSAGTPKTYTIDELSFNTTYYFAIKAKDIWGNTSSMSNVPNGVTFFAPELSVSCDSMHCVVLPNSTQTDSLIISNESIQNSTLDYTIELTNNTFPDEIFIKLAGIIREIQSPVIKNNPVEVKGLSFKGGGGPDLFGYEWIDSNEPNGPDYVWNDISSTGTVINTWVPTGSFEARDEGVAGPFPIGFDFKFYGEVKTQLYVNTNGVISFNNITSDIYSNASIPTAGMPDNVIAPFWDDLDGRTQGEVYYKQDGNKFIIQFTNWQKYTGTGSLTFQVVLQSNGKIYFYYNNLAADVTSCTVGIENSNGSDGLQIAYNAAYLENQLAVQIAAEPEWLTLNHYSGTLYNGNSIAVILNIIAEDLELGEYSMDMVITSNDPNNSEVTIPITMTVTNEVPVELSSLTAESINDEVILKWQTVTETNNSGFEIERSQMLNVNDQTGWQRIGFVEGKGTTTETQNYSFTDKPESGKYKYRLKQIDFSGMFTFSDEVNVEVEIPLVYALEQNYPNPFNPSTTIKYSIPEDGFVKLAVYNLLGEEITTLANNEQKAGRYEVMFDASRFSSGVYIYRLESKNFLSIKKMILVK